MAESLSGAMRLVGRAACAAALCVVMVEEPLVAAAAPKASPVRAGEVQGDARVVHALNRLTFGPRPGDLAAVKAMGLDRWLEQQLNPGGIDDSALEGRLAAFPAMRLPQGELMRRFPNPQVIRTMVKQDLPLPLDPMEQAIYGDQIAFYKMREAAKGQDGGKKTGPAMNGGGMEEEATVAKGQAALMAEDAVEAQKPDPLAVAPEEHVGGLYPEADAARVIGFAPDARVAAILRMKPQDLVAFRRSLSKRELAALMDGLSAEQKETLGSLAGSQRVIRPEVLQARMLRDVYSERQLEAVMTDFWLNHFNVYGKKSQLEPFLIPAYEREVVRPRALGKFEDLLVATAMSPAMLVYLDNWRSTGPESRAASRGRTKEAVGLNENYGRELMELHTLGVGGGYTQADVTQVAKVFTGWTIEKPYQGGTFTFAENRHEPGSKVVMGRTIPEGCEKEGLEVLHMLATSPATAQFISTKLAVRFVSDEPPAALVDKMAKAFLASGGDMKTVLRTMWGAPEFWSTDVVKAKVKTPEEFVISAVRAAGAEVGNAQPLVQALERLGMPFYGMQTPNGYSWKQDGWVSTGALVSRMNFALVLSGDRVSGVRTRWPEVLDEGGVRAVRVSAESAEAAKERRLEGILLGGPVSERTRAAVLAQFGDETMTANAEKEFDLKWADGKRGRVGLVGDAQAAGMAGLLLGSPEFQRR